MKTTPLPSVVHATCVTDGELRLEQQIAYQEQIQKKLGLNLVMCGQCGSVQFHPCKEAYHTCYDCGEEMDRCDFPDVFYKEMDYVPFIEETR